MEDQGLVPIQSTARWLALVGMVLAMILIPFFAFGEGIDDWVENVLRAPADHKTVAGFILGLLLAVDILLPVPSSLVSTGLGALLGWAVGTIVSTLGMTAACWVGYQLGRGAGRVAARRLISLRELAWLEGAWTRWGSAIVLLLRAVPALAEASTILAGMGRMRQGRFLLLAMLSNAIISTVYATVGAYAVSTHSFLLAFTGAVLIPALVLWAAHRLQAKGASAGSEKLL
jgi:membrane protein DedA with SNARE-associated domain